MGRDANFMTSHIVFNIWKVEKGEILDSLWIPIKQEWIHNQLDKWIPIHQKVERQYHNFTFHNLDIILLGISNSTRKRKVEFEMMLQVVFLQVN